VLTGARPTPQVLERAFDEADNDRWRELHDLPDFETYKLFFDEEIRPSVIEPKRHQIIVWEPNDPSDGDPVTRFRTTDCHVTELLIPDFTARDRALWLNAWSQNFSLLLQPDFDARRTGRSSFFERLPAHVVAPV